MLFSRVYIMKRGVSGVIYVMSCVYVMKHEVCQE